MNPGLFDLFPWGAAIANNFTQYQFASIRFRYVPTSGNALNSTNTALGTVTCRCLYDPTETIDDNYGVMQNSYGSYRSPPTVPFTYACSVNSSATNVQKIRLGVPPAGSDMRMYDLGIFEFASNGVQGANTNLGQLFVDYEVRLLKPRLSSGFRGLTALYCHFQQNSCNWSPSNPFGTGSQGTLPVGSAASNTLLGYIPEYAPSPDGLIPASGPVGTWLLLPRSTVAYRMQIVVSWQGNGAPLNPVVFPPVGPPTGVTVDGVTRVMDCPDNQLWSTGLGGQTPAPDNFPYNIVQELTYTTIVDVQPYDGNQQRVNIEGGTLPINASNLGNLDIFYTILPYNAV